MKSVCVDVARECDCDSDLYSGGLLQAATCAFGPMSLCHVDLELLAWPLGLNLKKGLKCNFGKFGTVSQLKIWTILKVKKEKWTDLKIKRYLDCFEN